MKKILMVNNFYQIGGGEHTVFKNEMNMLKKHGHTVIEYTRNNEELKYSKLQCFFLPINTVWSFRTYREVLNIIKKENIDIVHCHNTFPLISPSVYYAASRMKIPVIQTIHNFRFLCPAGVFFCKGAVCEQCNIVGCFHPALKNKCYRNSRLQTLVLVNMLRIHRALGTYKKISYIFLSEFTKSKFKKLIDINSPNVYVKPNFVTDIIAIKQEKHVDPCFVFASRLEESKGLLFLLKVWKKLPQHYMLHIYGDGPLGDYVEKEAENTKNIVFYGFQSQDKVFGDLSKSIALVFPSIWYETFGMIVAEAFSIGCPVVASNIGNASDLVRESKGGVTYEVGDEDNFIQSIEKIIENRNYYSANAIQYYKDNLSEEENYKRLSEIYDKARYID